MAGVPSFRDGETAVDEALGYPRAYAKLCKSSSIYSSGPPREFQPYALQNHETASSEELDRMFPVIDSERISAADLEPYVDLLWKKLSHLANAGFDPALFRVDPYGNVLYLNADPSSPLSWRIDHWFPRKRGGRTVLSNLRLVQWQVYKATKNKLEFTVPWWDLQLGISVNQFLSVFASRNSDFRNRAFSFLFKGGEDQVLGELKIADVPFPQKFLEKKQQIGLAAAAIASSRKYSDGSVLRSLNQRRQNRPLWPGSPSRGSSQILLLGFLLLLFLLLNWLNTSDDGEAIQRRTKNNRPKENEDPNICSNEYLSIAKARDSLREMEAARRNQAAIKESDEEVKDLSERNEAERIKIQDLEIELIRKRRRVEKCRRLSEAQASYRSQLERMIRDAMHQCVVYKEQARLNQAACSALLARLEAQKAMCDTSEEELLRRFKIREELEIQTVQQQTRKRPWEQEDHREHEEQEDLSRKLLECGEESIGLSSSSRRKMRKALRKELRVFLEEEQKASEAGGSLDEDLYMERCSDHGDEPEESQMSEIGKKNVEKWLEILLEKAEDKPQAIEERERSLPEKRRVERRVMIARPDSPRSSRVSFPSSPLNVKKGTDSPRSSRVSFPSSPLILKKGIDCILKKTRRI